MDRLLLALAVVAVAALVAEVVRRRRSADPPTQPRYDIPAQLDRSDFPGEGWLVAVFTSATCATCAKVLQAAELLEADDVAVQNIEVGEHAELHERYAITAVPAVVIADRTGVSQGSFLGPPTAADLWAKLAELRA